MVVGGFGDVVGECGWGRMSGEGVGGGEGGRGGVGDRVGAILSLKSPSSLKNLVWIFETIGKLKISTCSKLSVHILSYGITNGNAL